MNRPKSSKDVATVPKAATTGLPPVQALTEAAVHKLNHELQVYQAELEMQNEELLRATSQVNFLLTEFTDLYDFAPISYFTLGADGLIKRANLTAARLLGLEREKIAGRPFRNFVQAKSRTDFAAFMEKLGTADDGFEIDCELTLIRASSPPVYAHVTAVVTQLKQTYRMVVTNITERRLLEAERASQSQRIEELSHRLVALQEAERRKLGVELHDRTSGNLAALDLLLKDLAERMPHSVADELAPQLDDIRALLVETTRGIRDISSDIRPALLDHGGLMPALEDYAKRFSKQTGINVIVRADTSRRVNPELESVLYRIVQEALTNCAKHSHAKNINITLSSPAERVALTIGDDGYGFLPESLFGAAAHPGLGIVSMKERAEFSGGHFSLRSTPGKGTRITVEFKCSPRNLVWVARKSDRRRNVAQIESSDVAKPGPTPH